MRGAPLYVLLAVIAAGTLAIAPGTRSMTDVKDPIIVVGALLAAVVLMWQRWDGRQGAAARRAAPFAAMAGAWLLYTAASRLWASAGWTVGYVTAGRGLVLILAAAAAVTAADARRWRTIAGAYVALGAATAVFSLAMHSLYPYFAYYPGGAGEALWNLARHGLTAPGGGRALHTLHDVRIPMGNANLLAGFLLAPAAFALGFLAREREGRRRWRVTAALAATLGLVVVVFALCRSVSYGLGLGVLATVFAALRSRRPGAVLIAAGVLGAAGMGVAWRAGYVERFIASKSVIVRAELMRRAWEMAAERPTWGWGAGSYFTDAQRFAARRATAEVTYHEGGAVHTRPLHEVLAAGDSNAHSEYLQHAAEGGAAGLALYLAVLAAATVPAVRARRRGTGEDALLDGALALWAAYLVTNAMNPEAQFAEFGAHFWVVAGMLAAAGSLRAGGGAKAAGAVGRGAAVVADEAAAEGGRAWRLRAGAALLATAAAAYGAWTFGIVDYRASRAFAKAEAGGGGAAELYLEAAEGTWDRVLRARALYAAGLSLRQAGRREEAIEVFGTISREVFALGHADYLLGGLYEERGDLNRALAHYRRHAAGHPEDPQVAARAEALAAFLYSRSLEGER